MYNPSFDCPPQPKAPKGYGKDQETKFGKVVTLLQFPSGHTVIRDSHAQENGNCPIEELAGDHENGDLWFVLAGEMELE